MNQNLSGANLEIDVSAALPAVGDRRHIEGTTRVVVLEGYDALFEPGPDVSWSLELRRIAGAVEVSGAVEGAVTLQCFRCLEDFSFPLSIELREHALWLNDPEAEIDREDSPDYLVTDGMLDLEPVLRDSIALAFPVKRVCGEGCRGLCAGCGANLNIEECECEPETGDERLEPLAMLKLKLEQREAERRE